MADGAAVAALAVRALDVRRVGEDPLLVAMATTTTTTTTTTTIRLRGVRIVNRRRDAAHIVAIASAGGARRTRSSPLALVGAARSG